MFACTARTGPVSIPLGYLGSPPEDYTNSQALGNLHNFPYYRVKNSQPSLQRQAAVRFRANAAFGMKPVTYSFVPTFQTSTQRYRPSTSLTDVQQAFPSTDSAYQASNTFSRRRAGMIQFGNWQQSGAYDPTYGATSGHGQSGVENINTYYHGVCVSTRPGSWTMNCFPGMTVYTRITLRFYKRKTLPVENSAYAGTINDFLQMSYGNKMFGF